MIAQSDLRASNIADAITPAEAESLLLDLAAVFLSNSSQRSVADATADDQVLNCPGPMKFIVL